MAKKNMDILLGNILGKAAIHPQDRFDKSPGNPQEQQISAPNTQAVSDSLDEDPWRHFSFICSKELVGKVQTRPKGRFHHPLVHGIRHETRR